MSQRRPHPGPRPIPFLGRNRSPRRFAVGSFPVAALVAAWLASALPLQAQATLEQGAREAPATAVSEARRLLAPEDYGRFESLGAAALSDDGRWVAAVVSRVEEDGEVRFGSTRGGELRVVENGARFELSSDGAWIAVAVQPSRSERERLERDRQQPKNDLKLLATGSGEEHLTVGVQSFAFSPDGRFLLMRKYRPGNGGGAEGARTGGGGGSGGERGAEAGRGTDAPRGVDVVIRELATGVVVNFGNVSEAEWASDGATLAMSVDADGRTGNGVRLYEAASGRIRTLHAEPVRYGGLSWRKDSGDLAVFKVQPDSARGDTLYTVLAWRDATRDGSAVRVLEGTLASHDGRELRVSDVRGLRWAEDGSRLFVAVQPRREKKAAATPQDEEDRPAQGTERGERNGRNDDVPGVEIWHTRDVDPVPQQRVRANDERRRSGLAAWDLAGAAVPLGGERLDESISVVPGDRRALLMDDAPYALDRMFGPVYRDLYLVDVTSGARERAAERIEYSQGVSPDGRYLLFFRDDHFWVHDIASGETRNITASVPGTFADQEVDRPVKQRPPYGVGGWTEGDRHVLLYDRYDIWRVRADGQGGERLTRGDEEDVRHRLVRLDPEQDAWPVNGPWFVSLYGDFTKRSGYGRLVPGRDVQRLVWEDRGISRLMQSEDGSTLAFVAQRVDEPPVLKVAGRDLRSQREVVRTNAFAREFLWGKGQLIDYQNAWGRPLQAALHYPADYQPGRTYPMIVYPYELRSNQLHAWTNPSERSAYNTAVFTQNGYFVLQPDIVYRSRNPGVSFMEAVLPAVDAAVATGMIDPERIGLTGHSWGGYQTTFAVTQTDRFAAAVAGAPLTNLESMYLSFYWNTGGTDARIFEISQGRMEVPWWEDPDSYVANSPVHHIQKMRTPLLMAFGTEDGAVEFNQGVEFYNAARRLGKDFVLLVYEGENHGLAKKPNQIDYHRRSLEWFDHYLKGAPAPSWITEGMRYLDQQEELKQGPAGRAPVPPRVTATSGAGS